MKRHGPAYTEFPIGRFSEGDERWWTTDLSGTKAIAIKGDLVLAAGGDSLVFGVTGWRRYSNLATMLRLDDQSASRQDHWILPFEAIDGARNYDLLDARGDKLHLVTAGQWYRWNVEDFVATLAP